MIFISLLIDFDGVRTGISAEEMMKGEKL